MAEDILENMDDDFDDDAIDDMLDDALMDSSDQTNLAGKKFSLKKVGLKVKEASKKVPVSKKIIIIIAVVLIFIILMMAGAWFFLFNKGSEDSLDTQNSIGTSDNMQTESIPEPEIIFKDIIDLEPFEFARLKSGSTMGSINVNLSLELADQSFRKQIYTMEDEIRDVITQQIEKMGWLELRNPEGKIMLKYNILKRINSMFPKATVRNIYFTYFIMQ